MVPRSIKPIETLYKGYHFRSRLEARWAVFLDHCGAEWEYEPQGFELENGAYYLPDFFIHNVAVRNFEEKETCDIYCEVKGVMSKEDSDKIRAFSKEYKILVLGRIPDGEGIYDIMSNAWDQHYEGAKNCLCPPFGFDTLDGDGYTAVPCKTISGLFGIVGPDWYDDNGNHSCDIAQTLSAYSAARKARFEHGEHGYADDETGGRK